MGLFSPGFRGTRREDDSRIPPGQYLERGFPVLSTGATERIGVDEWRFTVTGTDGESRQWTWDEMIALGLETITTDIHCVTSWSKLDTTWRGVSIDHFLDGLDGGGATHVMAHAYGGYTTNMPLDELRGRAWLATEFDGKPLAAEHGGPARLLVPHLYLWKSAKWVDGLRMMTRDSPGFWERNGYNMHGDPWREERYAGV
ncbi:MAG: molybdopterin-dependent oxidoreductase [Naasia sp.]